MSLNCFRSILLKCSAEQASACQVGEGAGQESHHSEEDDDVILDELSDISDGSDLFNVEVEEDLGYTTVEDIDLQHIHFHRQQHW